MRLLPTAAILSFLVTFSVADPPTLLNALKSSGASRFAQVIESSPTLLTFFVSSQVKTVYAPADACDDVSARSRMKRQSLQDILDQQHQTESDEDTAEAVASKPAINTPGGAVVPGNNSNPSSTKRWAGLLGRRKDNDTTPTSILRMFSGLGNNVSIIVADIQYDGGILHIVDGYFTLPFPLSTTCTATGQTSFSALLNTTNSTSSLEAAANITVFIPSNAAFTATNASTAYPSTSALLAGHVISGFVGYLPLLKNGNVYATQGGGNVTISTRGADVFVNNAKIVKPNLVIPNGVAHVVDQIVTSASKAKPSVVVTSGGLRSVRGGVSGAVILSGAAVFAASLT